MHAPLWFLFLWLIYRLIELHAATRFLSWISGEDEGEEETIVGEMEIEVVSFEGKGAVVIHQTGETVSQ
jgi:hypothetical protein